MEHQLGLASHLEADQLDVESRLLHHYDVISINGPSYRLKNRLAAIERDQESAA